MEESRDASSRGEVFKNPFDHGYRKNFRRVFGDDSWLAVVLINFRNPPDPEYPWKIEDYSGYNPPITNMSYDV